MAEQATSVRRCIGSARFGIEPHEAPVEDFPRQPSQKDGLGRMCKPHWNRYTAGLARDAKARTAAAQGDATTDTADAEAASKTKPERARKRSAAESSWTPVAGAQGDAG